VIDHTREGYTALAAARVKVVTAPSEEPLSVDDVIIARNLTGADYDEDFLANLIPAARQVVEKDTGRSLVTQTVDCYFDALPYGSDLYLPVAPLQSVTSLTTYDTSNVATVYADSNYLVDTASTPGRIALGASAAWPGGLRRVNGVVVRAVVGYGGPSDVPAALKQAMLLMIGAMDEHREQVMVSQFAGQFIELPFGYAQLIEPYRLWLA
jgi:uncharacterized phiE125 gp8 family phage protein